MKANPDFTIRTIGDVSLIVSLMGNAFHKEWTVTTNESGALLWQTLKADCTKKDLLDAILSAYEVDESTALSDIDFFLDSLRRANALIE